MFLFNTITIQSNLSNRISRYPKNQSQFRVFLNEKVSHFLLNEGQKNNNIKLIPPVFRCAPSAYGYHQADVLSRYCADSPILCADNSNRGKDNSPSREKKLPSSTTLGEPRMFWGFVGLSSMFKRFLMENGESLAGWRVSCASESAITPFNDGCGSPSNLFKGKQIS